MKLLPTIILILAASLGMAGDLSNPDRKVARLKDKIQRQHEALEASQTALLYVVTHWSSRGGTMDQPEFLFSVAALRKIEEARP